MAVAAAAGALIGAAGGIGSTVLNNMFAKEIAEDNYWYAKKLAHEDRAENYYYNEQAAINADARSRKMYNDIYSPQALLDQYYKAGLSPSLMFGGTPGQGGTSGAQGAGASGPMTQYTPRQMFGIDPMQMAEIANIVAQTKKTEAETENIQTDTQRGLIQKGIEELQAGKYKNEFAIINSTWTEDGQEKSIFEAAKEHYTYDSFLNWCRGEQTDEVIKDATTTEAGQKVLREIYLSASHFNRDISVLTEETVSSNFQINVINALKAHDYEKMNAEAAVAQLKQEVATNELTESQKEAWNNLIDRLGRKGSTGRDVAIVLGMILGNFASHTGIKVNVGR